SSIWSFTTNFAPDYPINPSPFPSATEIGLNPTLSVDISDSDGDSMDVSFYNASDDALIGTDYSVSSGGTAFISWIGLSEGLSYSWYVNIYDGSLLTTSSAWSFTVLMDTPVWEQVPIDQTLRASDLLNYNISATDISGIAYYWINDTSNFNIDTDGLLSNSITLIPGTYWLEIRAYDPYGYYCSAIIQIIVESPSSPRIPGYNIVFLTFIISIGSLLLIRKQIRKKH
ncbi:MAG: Loki-CTERM sorting domain-containing protein, partial [Promethearchaeota archaeon]